MTIRITQTRAPTSADAGYAVSRLGYIPRRDANALRTQALNAGFTDLGNDTYQHADGSWVKLEQNGIINRGVGSTQFQGIPGGRTTRTTRAAAAAQPAAPPPPPAPRATTTSRDGSRPALPSTQWAWWQQNTALGKLPRVSIATAPAECARLGFVQSGSQWLHADGSWVDLTGGRVRVGWKGYGLGELPYNNRYSNRP